MDVTFIVVVVYGAIMRPIQKLINRHYYKMGRVHRHYVVRNGNLIYTVWYCCSMRI